MTQFLKEFTDTRDFLTTFVTTLAVGLETHPDPSVDAWVASGDYDRWYETLKHKVLGDLADIGLDAEDDDALAALLAGFNIAMEVWFDWISGAAKANPLVGAIAKGFLAIEPATAKFFVDLLGDEYLLQGDPRAELVSLIDEAKRDHAENCEHCREGEAHEAEPQQQAQVIALNAQQARALGLSVTDDDDDSPIGMYL